MRQRADWPFIEHEDDLSAAMSRPAGRVARLAGVAVALLVLGLLTLAVWSAVGITEQVPSPCQVREAREGSGYVQLHGHSIERLRASTRLRVAVRYVDAAGYRPDVVVRVSACDAPQGFNVVAYVAA